MTKKKRGFLDGYKTYDTTSGFGNPKMWQNAFRKRMTKEDAKALLKEQNKSPDSLLGIAPDATKEEIRKAYHMRMMEWHPDRNPHRMKEAEEMSKQLNAAYSFLTA